MKISMTSARPIPPINESAKKPSEVRPHRDGNFLFQ
jgi:hypothetical protein